MTTKIVRIVASTGSNRKIQIQHAHARAVMSARIASHAQSERGRNKKAVSIARTNRMETVQSTHRQLGTTPVAHLRAIWTTMGRIVNAPPAMAALLVQHAQWAHGASSTARTASRAATSRRSGQSTRNWPGKVPSVPTDASTQYRRCPKTLLVLVQRGLQGVHVPPVLLAPGALPIVWHAGHVEISRARFPSTCLQHGPMQHAHTVALPTRSVFQTHNVGALSSTLPTSCYVTIPRWVF
mmetsp:Transcript_47789/g.139402  ORF Transcript_47789/g.139402 Transcript_47789/m.139402 type:complete len:239 (+) Transcript_47789:2003-2719(+)